MVRVRAVSVSGEARVRVRAGGGDAESTAIMQACRCIVANIVTWATQLHVRQRPSRPTGGDGGGGRRAGELTVGWRLVVDRIQRGV